MTKLIVIALVIIGASFVITQYHTATMFSEPRRWAFSAPVPHYKAALAFVAWLDGQQPNAMLVNHEGTTRDREHYLGCAELARAAGVSPLDDDGGARTEHRATPAPGG